MATAATAPAATAMASQNNVNGEVESKSSALETKIESMAQTLNKMEKATTEKKNDKIKPMKAFASTLPQIRVCHSWDEFKNHHSRDEHRHAIETLVAGDSLKAEMDDAAADGNGDESYYSYRGYRGSGAHAGGYFGRGGFGYKSSTVIEDGDETWLHQVRINSKFLMTLLGRLSSAGKNWKGRPLVFMRPFRYFIHFHAEMKKELAERERAKAISSSEAGGAQEMEAGRLSNSVAPDSLGLERLFSPDDAEAELAELRLYVGFVDTEVMPNYERFSGDTPLELPARIRWDDVGYLFRPGAMIYAPPSSYASKADPARFAMDIAGFIQDAVRGVMGSGSGADAADTRASTNATRASDTDQMIWKVYRPPYKESAENCSCLECLRNPKAWKVLCYYIDHDGQEFRAVGRTISISVFNGERDVAQLPCYPICYMKRADQVMKAGRINGMKFLRYIDPANKYAFYRGWTVIREPAGKGISDKLDRPMTSPEHIESEIIVDFGEAFNTNPSWRPDTATLEEETYHSQMSTDQEYPLREWADEKRTELVAKWEDRCVYSDGVDILEQNEFRKTDALLNRELSLEVDKLLRDENNDMLALFPRRMLAYALWERKFIPIDVRNIQAPNFDDKDKAFQNLEISHKHKTMIESLVYSHFQRRRIENNVDLGSLDIIRGKGKGICILLFGVPGVGKTATAEAVAQKFEKPLFPITCGDLGFTPQSVESSLTEIFRLAHLWDCVLLLDEADVFITARTEADLEKNALVSVFLRMLEYYSGILFLTTNRPGVLDEAVKSRVHLNLHYKALTEPQVLSIFKLNIARLQDMEDKASRTPGYEPLEIQDADILDFASEHWHNNDNDVGRWNGRQIRNAFLIASSLAHYESDARRKRGIKSAQRVLTAQHFRQVEEMTRRYDEYRKSVLGDTDSFIAFDQRVRDDEFAASATRKMPRGGGRGGYPAVRRESVPLHHLGEPRPNRNGGATGNTPGQARGEYFGGGGGGGGAGTRAGSGAAANYPLRNANTPSGHVGNSYDEVVGQSDSMNSQVRRGPQPEDDWNGNGSEHWD